MSPRQIKVEYMLPPVVSTRMISDIIDMATLIEVDGQRYRTVGKPVRFPDDEDGLNVYQVAVEEFAN